MKKCFNCNLQYEDAKVYCPNCGGILETVSGSRKQKKINKSVVVTILLVLSIGLNIFLGLAVYDTYEREEFCHGKWIEFSDKYFEILPEYEFYNDYARIVPDDGLDIYHRYECEKLDLDYEFNIYNLDLAKYKASPCQECCADD